MQMNQPALLLLGAIASLSAGVGGCAAAWMCKILLTKCITWAKHMQMNQPALLLLADDAHLGNLTKPGVVFVAILITRRHPHHLTNRASYHHLRRRTPCLDRALTNPNDLTPVTAYA